MSVKNQISRRQVVFGSTLGASVLLAGALLGIVSYLSQRHYQRFDWTSSQLYTLSEKTQNILADLEQEIDAVVFMDPQTQAETYEPVRELLARYQAASSQITVEHVDPVKNLAKAQQLVDTYDIQQADVVVFVAGEDRRVVSAADLAEYDYSAMQTGGSREMTGFKGEQEFTRAILELVERRKPKLLFTAGHGEASLSTYEGTGLQRLQDFLGQDNFEIEEWKTLGATAVPEGADLVVVAGPTSPFVEPELALFDDYLAAGGRMLVLLDPQLSGSGEAATESLTAWLAGQGVLASEAIVVDPAKLLPFFGAETIFADAYGFHPITQSLQQARLPAVFALARPVAASADTTATVTELVRTSAEGWGETDLANLDKVELGEGDLAGPVSLGVAVELATPEDEGEAPVDEPGEAADDGSDPGPTVDDPPTPAGRLVVFGDSDFVRNSQIGQAGNGTLVANTMNWLVERESHLGIAPKEPEDVRLSLTPPQRQLIFWFVLAGLPSLCLVAGATIHVRRRRN